MTQPLNPAMAATFAPPVMEARRWLLGVTFPPERPLINVSQAAPVDPPPQALRRAIAEAALERADAHLYGPVLGRADLREAVGRADIISSATMARQPVILGDWVRPGTHVDLIGAFKADMREADDALMAKAALFVDSRATTLGHIGELLMPLASASRAGLSNWIV